MIALEEKIYSPKQFDEISDREVDAVAHSRVMNGHVVIGTSGEPYKMSIEKMEPSQRGLVPRYSTDKNAAIRLALELANRNMSGRFAGWVYELSKGDLITTDKHYEPCVDMDVLFGIITMSARQLTIAAIMSTQYDVDGREAQPGPASTWLEVRRENDWAFEALKKLRTPKPPIYHEDEDGDWQECPECGQMLTERGATGHTDVKGVPVEMDTSWLECECGYIWND